MIISFISQKGGVSRSTLARAGQQTLLADLDSQQQTSAKWAERRDHAGIHPAVETAVYRRHSVALKAASQYACLIIDTRPFVDISSFDIAQHSSLVVIATGTALDDLEPSLLLGRELLHRGIPLRKILYVICKAPTGAEARSAMQTISTWQFRCVKSYLRFKAGYSLALDAGQSVTETRWPSLNRHAENIIREICTRAEAVA